MAKKIADRSPTEVDRHAAARIRQARLDKGLTQEELGKLIDAPFQQIQRYENGINRVGASRLFLLAQVLDVSVEFFFMEMSSDLLAKILPVSPEAAREGYDKERTREAWKLLVELESASRESQRPTLAELRAALDEFKSG